MFKVGDFVYCPGGLDGSYYGRIIEIDNSHVACYKSDKLILVYLRTRFLSFLKFHITCIF